MHFSHLPRFREVERVPVNVTLTHICTYIAPDLQYNFALYNFLFNIFWFFILYLFFFFAVFYFSISSWTFFPLTSGFTVSVVISSSCLTARLDLIYTPVFNVFLIYFCWYVLPIFVLYSFLEFFPKKFCSNIVHRKQFVKDKCMCVREFFALLQTCFSKLKMKT